MSMTILFPSIDILDAALSQIAELIELLIASAAFLYLYLNSNRLLDDGQSEQGAES